jgi:putative endonuclease
MFSLYKKRPSDNSSLSLGKRGELAAQELYQKQGYTIIATNEINHRGKQVGEIDFIAVNGATIIFVEVKTRTQEITRHGSGADAVNYYKQVKIVKAAKYFLARNPEYSTLQPNIDVCVVIMSNLDKAPKRVTIISNAVEDLN